MTRMYLHKPLKITRQTLLGLVLALFVLTAHAAHQLGDLAPSSNPDGVLNADDLVVLQRLVNGTLTPELPRINQDNEIYQ